MYDHRQIPPTQSEPNTGLSCILLLLIIGAVILGLVLGATGPSEKQGEKEISQEIKWEEQNIKEGTGRDFPFLIILLLVSYILGLISGIMLTAPRYYG